MNGHVTAFFLFDVAESIDLRHLAQLMAGATAPARFASKPAAPQYVGYAQPPLQLDPETLGLEGVEGWQLRAKTFDYGVISLAFSRAIDGGWPAMTALSARLSNDDTLEQAAERCSRTIVERIRPALVRARDRYLSEDYFVFAVTDTTLFATADALLSSDGERLAQLLRGELEPLSSQERDEVLRHRLSYLATDLVVPTWRSAFVYDTEQGVQAALEIFEYANSQLLQFRYYDELLDARLQRIYKELESSRDYKSWRPRRYTRAARELHALFIDVNELTDRTENALKLVGDVYAARLLALAHARLGVTAWRDSVHDKLKTLDQIYRFAVDQTAMDRGEVLELAIVGILVFELVLFFMGIMR
jgi:hypothetical protein